MFNLRGRLCVRTPSFLFPSYAALFTLKLCECQAFAFRILLGYLTLFLRNQAVVFVTSPGTV